MTKTIVRPSIPLDEATDLALEIIGLLSPYATRITLGGSIRRGKERVGDIEIIAQSDFQDLPVGRGGFLRVPKTPALQWITDVLLAEGKIEQRFKSNGALLAWGERYRAFAFQGVAVDLFIVTPPRQWGVIHLIRTGPGDANEALVTQANHRTSQGLLGVLPEHLQFDNGQILKNGFPLETPEESDVFKALDFPYIPPPERTAVYYQQVARNAARNPGRPHTFPKDYNDLWRGVFRYVLLTNPPGFVAVNFYKE